MPTKPTNYREIEDVGLQLVHEIQAILDEHLPAEMSKAVWQKVEALQSNVFCLAAHTDLLLYRALMGFLPEHGIQIRAAFHGTVFEGCVMDEKDWPAWERGVTWHITPGECDMIDGLVDKRGEDDGA